MILTTVFIKYDEPGTCMGAIVLQPVSSANGEFKF